jgi:hypothetical protein
MTPRSIGPIGGPKQPTVATSLATKTQRPRHLSASHWAELVEKSGITPALAAANFKSFGEAPFADPEAERQALLAEAFALLNPQPGHSYQRRMKLQWQYGHLDGGGWRFIGSALPGFAPTPRWKPDSPRISRSGRAIKYESAPKRRPGLLLPQVPITVWRLVAERHGLPMPADRSAGFWAWALATPGLPLVVVEGEKKACALLGLGLAAVGLPGVEMGRMVLARDAKGRACDEALVPELVKLAAGGRSLLIAFDAEDKPSTARKVEGAAVRLGHLLVKAGAEVKVARLPLLFGEDKTGPDDLLVALGPDALLEALADGLALAELAWERRHKAERRTRATCAQLRVGGGPGPLVEALKQATAAIVGIRAPKGFGKTKALEQSLAERPMVLAVTHRRSLGAAMASRLGLVWRNDADSALGRTLLADGEVIDGLPPRYCLCIDSLLAIKPEAFKGATLVLDEAEQVLAHLLTSSTCREQRGLLIQRLQAIVANASQVIALDADLSDATLQWLQQAKAGPCDQLITGPALALITAEGTPQGWPVYWYEQGAEQLEQALLEAAAKAPVFVTTDSRERAAALHQLLQHHLPEAKGLLITSATTSSPDVQQWLAKLTDSEALAAGGIRWVVASPSISSGLSIEHLHFRSVWGVFGAGSFDDSEALQALARIRQGVARHVWVKPVVRPQQPPLSSAWWPQQAEGDLRQRWNGQAALLRQQLQPDLLLEPNPGSAAEALAATCALWADLTSRRNYSHSHLRPFIKARLRAEGHQLMAPVGTISQPEAAELKALKSQLKGDRQQAHAEAVASAPIISAAEADRQRRLQQHSPALQRRALVERLALEPEALTPSLVLWGERWAGAAERLACLLEPTLALALDAKRLAATTPKGEAPLPWDQSFRTQRQQAAEDIGLAAFIKQFPLGGKSWSNHTPEVQTLAAQARNFRNNIKTILGISVTPAPKPPTKDAEAWEGQNEGAPDPTATKVVGELLATVGITTTSQRNGSSARNYRADADQLKLLREAAERLCCKGLGLAPHPAVLEGFANKTATCGAPLPELASPWLKRASCEQLAIATDGHHSTQLQGGGAASEAPKGSRCRPPHHHWGPGGSGNRGPASRQ